MVLSQNTSEKSAEYRKLVICHFGHENDVICTENIFEFLTACDIAHDFIDLSQANAMRELRQCLADGSQVSLLGFNSQLDHAWVDDEPLLLAAARHGVTAMQWVLDHPSGRWPEFNYSDPRTSRFLFHSRYSQSYFTKYCCPGTHSGGREYRTEPALAIG